MGLQLFESHLKKIIYFINCRATSSLPAAPAAHPRGSGPLPMPEPRCAPLPEDNKVTVLWQGPSNLPPKPFKQRGSRILFSHYKTFRIRLPYSPPELPTGLTGLPFAVRAAVQGVPALLYFPCTCYSPQTSVLAGEEQPWAHTHALCLALHSRTWLPGAGRSLASRSCAPSSSPSLTQPTRKPVAPVQRLFMCLRSALNFYFISKQPRGD